MPDFYRAPAFQFYVDDFLAGCSALDGLETGAYFLLICACWSKGGVPDDILALARIAKLSVAQMRRVWPAIRGKFAESPHDPALLSSPRLESVRGKAAAFSDRQRANGAHGGRPKKPTGFSGDDNNKPTAFSGETQTEPKKSSPVSGLLSLDAAAEDIELTTRAHVGGDLEVSEAMGFGQWFLHRGVALGVIPEHQAIDSYAWAYRQLVDAEKLVGTYGLAECQARSERFLAARAAGKIRRAADLRGLSSSWDFIEVAPSAATIPTTSSPTPSPPATFTPRSEELPPEQRAENISRLAGLVNKSRLEHAEAS